MPFSQKRSGDSSVVRTFSQDVDEDELKWHRDAEDRFVSPVRPTDWLLQMDNQLPKRIDGEVFITAGVYHRDIKGSGDVVVEVRMNR
jgi:hypothetical protein